MIDGDYGYTILQQGDRWYMHWDLKVPCANTLKQERD